MPLALKPLPPSVRPLTDEDFKRLKTEYPSLWVDWRKTCITCKKSPAFRARTRAGVEEFVCSCKDQNLLHLWLLRSGLDTTYQRVSWDDVTHADPTACVAVADYVKDASALVGGGLGLTLWSPALGTGKTMLATLVLKGLIRDGYDCYSTLFGPMMDAWADGWKDAEARKWFTRRVTNCDVLLVDDVGSESRRTGKTLEAVESMFDRVVRTRYGQGKPTLVTTNLTPERLMAGYGGSVMSLLAGVNESIEVPGLDYRKTRQQPQAKRDALDGLRRPIVLDALR